LVLASRRERAAASMASDSRSCERRDDCCRGMFISTITSHSLIALWYWIGPAPMVKSG